MKRLVPLEEDSSDLSTIRSKYKNVIKFLCDDEINPEVDFYEDALNAKQPNMLKITTSYDYGDFGFISDREYDVRQIGMLNHLCCSSSSHELIRNKSSLYNNDEDTNKTLADLFGFANSSLIIPVGFNVNDFNDKGMAEKDWTKVDTSGFFGILQFYINTRANNRITYQTDYYNFILKFENKLKCSCTCDTCENN